MVPQKERGKDLCSTKRPFVPKLRETRDVGLKHQWDKDLDTTPRFLET